MTEIEIPLAGGNVNTGVVRVGDTVRRAQTLASATIHGLLQEGYLGHWQREAEAFRRHMLKPNSQSRYNEAVVATTRVEPQ